MIRVVGPKDARDKNAINTTSSSVNWSKGLSPFFLGPVELYSGYVSKNVENGWQFSKVYKKYLGEDGLPNEDYWKWAEKGWNDSYAHRYPAGKGSIPEYAFWNGSKLGYIEARKQIYIPLYQQAVKDTEVFKKLKELYQTNGSITLFDYDGYDYLKLGYDLNDVLHDASRKMGHGFVLAMMLQNE